MAFTYDELGRKTAEFAGSTSGTKLADWLYDGATNGVGLPWYSTRYTADGKYITGVSVYNGRGQVGKAITQIPAAETGLNALYTTSYSYTTTGQQTGLQQPTAGGLPGEGIGMTYDKYGNPLTTLGYNAYVSESVYTPFGEASSFTLGPSNNTARLSYEYDPQTARLIRTNLSAQKAQPQIDDTRYSYDPAGNITKAVNTQGPEGSGPVRTQCYDYDTLRRLVDAWTATDDCAATPSTAEGHANIGGPTPYWTSWTFEPSGLRGSQIQHALPGATGDTATTYTYPANGTAKPHALTSTTTGPGGTSTSTYGYDEVGNTTKRALPSGEHTLFWDQENRLEKVNSPTGTTKYVYDADGNQLVRKDPGKTTVYLPGQELARDTNTGTVTGTRYYQHNGVTVALRVGNTNPKYVVADLHNTMSVTLDSVGFAVSRRAMDPYGNPLGQVAGLPWPSQRGFLDKPVSEATGLTDIGARKYDASTGRFISVDPVLDVNNTQQMTGYCYANSNPTTFSDPSGLLPSGSYHIVGVGIFGIMGAFGKARDLQAQNGRSQQMSVSYTWGFLALDQRWAGPTTIPFLYIPFIIIGITFSPWVQACPPPLQQATKEKPTFSAPKLTRAQQAEWDRKNPVRPERMSDMDFMLMMTGIDQVIQCLRDPSWGGCAMAAAPFAAGPLARGIAVASRSVVRGAESVAIANAAGHATAREVRIGARADGQTVFAGHGYVRAGAGEVTVPRGTSISMYVGEGGKLKDSHGLAVELGADDAPSAVQIFGPGDSVPNYTLGPPRGDLVVASGSYTVDRSTQLRELLIEDMGMTHWAACREYIC